MVFQSVLFAGSNRRVKAEEPGPPEFFADLNLDQVIDALTADLKEYDLKPFFYCTPCDLDTILYRQEIMRDLENPALLDHVLTFARRMRLMREHLDRAEKLHHRHQKERWFLDAVEIYCQGVHDLFRSMDQCGMQSRGLLAFQDFLRGYIESAEFSSLWAETQRVQSALSMVKYNVRIRGHRIDVSAYDEEPEYSAEVEDTFAKFREGAAKDYRVSFHEFPEMNYVEEAILDRVALLFPECFAALDDYCSKHSAFLDNTVSTFDREVQFYVAYLMYIAPIKEVGLKFCYPRIAERDKEVYSYEGFDLALANKLVTSNSSVIRNDFYLKGQERIFVVTGPNQGGKTTFARTFGQMHYLASVGLPVPGREGRLFLFDNLFTHFERQEDIRDLRGRLEDDLVRTHAILEHATPNSIIVMNEIFNSTTLQDAAFLGKQVMEKIIELDALCVFVTFIDEFASLNPKVVSMVSSVLPEDPAVRTFVIERRLADGLAYAMSIARKYGLTYERLKERIRT